jgi:hypothetical protein
MGGSTLVQEDRLGGLIEQSGDLGRKLEKVAEQWHADQVASRPLAASVLD